MNIYQKLIEVRKSCKYLKKDNTGYKFSFVSSSQTLGSLREAMDKQGLLLIPHVSEYEVRDHKTQQDNHEYFTILKMMFTWVNAEKPDELINCPWTGQGLDSGEKGVGKALTYAEKYFLLKFFNIATDKDDPDNFQGKSENKKKPPYSPSKPSESQQAPKPGSKPEQQAGKPTDNQKRAIHKMCGALVKGGVINSEKEYLGNREANDLSFDEASKYIDGLMKLVKEMKESGV